MKMRVLVSVMTYPTLSGKHIETVCTAGFREDGTWIRIFPVPLRLLPTVDDNKLPYSKWQWIEVDLKQNPSHDDRPESYHINDIDSLQAMERIDKRGKPNWGLRLDWTLKNKRLFTNMTELLDMTRKNQISLAVLKPLEIKRVLAEQIVIDDEYRQRLLKIRQKYEADLAQPSLFDEQLMKRDFIFAEKIPYRFRYVFTTDDGVERKIMIEDWEICQLYRNLRKKHNEHIACQMVCDRYMELANKNDIYFFMGTSFQWQKRKSPDPYLIIGVFYPPKQENSLPSLFD